MNRCDRLQLSSECVLILLFSLEICSSIEFDIFFLFEKIKENNLTSSGVYAVDSALVRINSAIHITSSFELLASILNLYTYYITSANAPFDNKP